MLFPALSVIVLSVVWAVSLNLIRHERVSAERTAHATTQELLETYEAQVVRVLREIDQTLKSLQYSYQLRGDAGAILQDLADLDLLPPDLVFTVSMTDASGTVVASTRPLSISTSLDPNLIERSRTTDALLEDRSVRVDDEWWLRFTRRLIAPDGSFSGIAVVEAGATFFVSGYDSAKLGEKGVLAILGRDGVFRVRRSGEEIWFGERILYGSVVGSEAGFDETDASLSLNGWDGVRRFTSARELYDFPLAVVVGLSEDEQLASARARASTYLMRTTGGSMLLLLVLAFIGRTSWKLEDLRRRERESRVAHARHVEHLAYHDGLTGLPNRSFLTRIIDDRIRQARRYDRKVALLFLDLDGFKQINDTLGHDAGDDLLREVAKRLEDAVRKSDTVARMGGDEFMIVLPEVQSEDQVTTVSKNILSTLSAPFVLLGEKFNVTVSVGISLFPLDGDDEQTLIKNADIAMYAAKDGGKNDFRYFSKEMSSASEERMRLEASLRSALADEEFELYYQARRELETGRITGMEALLRWNHPELGTIGPNKFLPLAEDTGLIIPIGRWVLRTACKQNLAWRSEGLPRLSVSVNLSARQFFDVHLPEEISSILEETGLEPELLELEIGESVLARDTRKTLPVLERLKKIGVKITVDNFGTGYSALTALGQLPLDSIKIDRLFLREDAGSAAARDVINGVLAMGRVLSSSVIAHGVETREQVSFLRSHSFDQVQGYYFGVPFRAPEASEMLRADDAMLIGPERLDRADPGRWNAEVVS